MIAEPSEARLRSLLLGGTALLGPPLLLFLYYRLMFSGLLNGDALDFAQLGRNLSSGRGFVTYVLRPLSMDLDVSLLRQPDVTHGPLFPLLLALSFGALGAKDSTAAATSGLFYLLTLPVLYVLGARAFNRSVGAAAALVFALSSHMLEYAVSGLPITLYVFLATCLFLCLFSVASGRPEGDGGDAAGAPRAPRAPLILSGAACAALYLTEPLFLWTLPVALYSVVRLSPARRARAAGWFLGSFCLLALPWMARNWMLTGNPLFGLKGLEVWMHTRGLPGYYAYRLESGDLVAGPSLLADVARKALANAGVLAETLPQVTANWILAFFLPGLFFAFSNPAANGVRRATVLFLLALAAGMLAFSVQMPLFVACVPVLLVYSLAFLMHLRHQARLSRTSWGLVLASLSFLAFFPTAHDVLLKEKPGSLSARLPAQLLAQISRPQEAILSDQPWVIAWYADRPSIWIPAEGAFLQQARGRYPQTRWLLLTEQVRGYEPGWQWVHESFAMSNIQAARWSLADARSRGPQPPLWAIPGEAAGQGTHPLPSLTRALAGFTSVGPVHGVDVGTVLATVPQPAPPQGARSGKPEISRKAPASSHRAGEVARSRRGS